LDQARELFQSGHHLDAALTFERCLMERPRSPDALQGLAVCALQRGEFDLAQSYASQAVEVRSEDPALWHLLGRVHKELGDTAAAEDSYRQALRADPQCADAHVSLGILLRRAGRLDEAAACYRRALQAKPRSKEALTNLGNILSDLGRFAEAIETLERTVALFPDAAGATTNLGKLLRGAGRPDAAVSLLSECFRRNHDDGDVALELGLALAEQGRWKEAAEHYQYAVQLQPASVAAHRLMAEAVTQLGGFAESVSIYRRCLELAPGDVASLNNLSVALRIEGALGESLEMAERARALAPDLPEAHASVADALSAQGRAEEADRVYTQAADRFPTAIVVHTNRLLTSSYVDGVAPAILLERHREFGARFAPARVATEQWPSKECDRRLRIGYLSGDFRRHSVAYFMQPVLASHDPSRFEIVCYHTQYAEDEVTERLKRSAGEWVAASHLSDDRLASRIRSDRIDVLVDLAGHTAGNRLLVLARKPAPVQISYLGYPTTTGLPAMDYRITDWHVDPEGYEKFSTETLLRLPHSYYCYAPFEASPVVAALPAGEHGPITFGTFNNLAKVSSKAVELWANVLAAVPGSRILLKARGTTGASVTARIVERFAQRRVESDRVILHGWRPAAGGHLELYGEVDVALDTFPYNGGTTTCEALWMGVPVVSLSGATHASRMGRSILSAVGLPELVGETPEQFVATAVALVRDRSKLAALRAGLRERMRASPLMDGRAFTGALEMAYRAAWRRWCTQT
jgi:protein O-GlcNAc transferase